MRINRLWLSDFVDVPPLSELGGLLAAAGVEVDEVHDPGEQTQGVVVAEVRFVTQHPEADKLKVCTVSDGVESWQVVCGAPNVAASQRVALAKVGAKLRGMEVGRRELRGVESAGMLCSRQDLGLEGDSAGIWVLPATCQLGEDVFAAAQVTPTLELGITPNRPDLLSHLGVAREVAAALGKRLKPPKVRVVEKGPDVGTQARVIVSAPLACRRYCARVVRGLTVGPSPDWLRARLESIGQRSINNIVDVTNYVLHELGQPLHAFDLSRLAVEAGCPTVHVRRAREGESLTTLDGEARVLTPDDLVIADANRPVALAGVMGGADSEVQDGTTSVLLESAHFEPLVVRKCARRLGLHTESSHRFERGADPKMAQKAVDRCAQLLAEVAGGEIAKGVVEVSQKHEAQKEITLRLERIPKVLGVSLPAETVVQLLEPLEIRCTARNESALRFEAPSFRPDLTREIDLIEELTRRHGYDRIPERIPDASSAYQHEPLRDDRIEQTRCGLLASGCSEAITFGFGSPDAFAGLPGTDGQVVRLLNPLGEELSVMRTSLLPGLLSALARNQRHGAKHVRLFEIGTTFHPRQPSEGEDERDRHLPHEELKLGVVLYGGRYHGSWCERGENVDFSDLAGVMDAVSRAFALDPPPQRRAAMAEGLNPYCAAEWVLGERCIGHAGQVHPDLLAAWDCAGPAYLAEVSLAALAAGPTRSIRFQPLPKYPGTRRDLALVTGHDVCARQLTEFLEEHAGGEMGRDVVERVRLFDVYEGKGIPENHTSLAFSIEYRSRMRTLTDAEVSVAFEAVLEKIRQRFGLEVRSG